VVFYRIGFNYYARCRIAVVGFFMDQDVLVFIAASGFLVFHWAFLLVFQVWTFSVFSRIWLIGSLGYCLVFQGGSHGFS
jgi:hypothetical protein